MASDFPRWLYVRRATRSRAVRWMRVLLCAVLAFSMLPGSDELVETVAHLVHDGHLPHSVAHDEVAVTEDCDGSEEHGCTPLSHHCTCCASIAALPPWPHPATPLRIATTRERHRSLSERGPPSPRLEPFLRPPIA